MMRGGRGRVGLLFLACLHRRRRQVGKWISFNTHWFNVSYNCINSCIFDTLNFDYCCDSEKLKNSSKITDVIKSTNCKSNKKSHTICHVRHEKGILVIARTIFFLNTECLLQQSFRCDILKKTMYRLDDMVAASLVFYCHCE